MGSIGLVHIEDICNAHILLMQHPRAEGSYICCTKSLELSQLVNMLKVEYALLQRSVTTHHLIFHSLIQTFSCFFCFSYNIYIYFRHGSDEIIMNNASSVPSEISSKKLRHLGFNFKYSIKDILQETMVKCVDCEFLPNSKPI